MITTRQLEALHAVVEHGTVTGAAARLRLSQPAVSKLLASLEHATGLPLFRRAGRRLAPTPEARLLHAQAADLFRGLERIESLAGELRNLRAGRLAVAALPALGRRFVPGILAAFLRERPGVAIGLDIHASRIVLDAVVERRADIGLGMIPVDHPAVDSERLCVRPAVCALPPGHALADRGGICPADLASEPFVSFGRPSATRTRIDAIFEAAGVTRQLAIDTHVSDTACAFVAEGAGVALVDPFTAADYAARGEIVVRPFRPRVDYSFWLLRPRGEPSALLADTFVSALRQALAEAVAGDARSDVQQNESGGKSGA